MQFETAQQRYPLFMSYHHRNDQSFYRHLRIQLLHQPDWFVDQSLKVRINSHAQNHIFSRIYWQHLALSTCTVVLCGPQTHQRKFIDWEIAATLQMGKALVGILLPNNPQADVPPRLRDNLASGYAVMTTWDEIAGNNPRLYQLVQQAQSHPRSWIRNHRPLFERNGDESRCLTPIPVPNPLAMAR